MWREESDLLFSKFNGLDARRQHVAATAQKAESISDHRILETDAAELVAEIVQQGSVNVPVLNRDDITYDRKEVTEEATNVWGERGTRKRSVIVFEVPFEGDADIFRIQPSTYNMNPPRAKIAKSSLQVTVSDDADPNRIQQNLNSVLADIEKHLDWHREMWRGVSEEIAREAAQRIDARRQKLERDRKADDGLSALGFKPKA